MRTVPSITAARADAPGGGPAITDSPPTLRPTGTPDQDTPRSDADEVITALFRRFAPRVYGYARLRGTADLADDVVADTFLTAWRLRDRIPEDPLPWLLVIARHALSNRRRSAVRSDRLAVSMAAIEMLAGPRQAAEDVALDRTAVLAAVARLTDAEREALVLTAWDGLTQRDAARVAGCTQRTLARRLRSARHHLDRALAAPASPEPGHRAAGPRPLPITKEQT